MMAPLDTAIEDRGASVTAIVDQLVASRPSGAAQTSELSEPAEPNWVHSVTGELARLALLREGWDGYGAGPVRRDVLSFAAHLLARIMQNDTPTPNLTPMAHEGVLIEWREHGVELEIEIEAPAQVWVRYSVDGHEKEWPVRSDFHSLTSPIAELTKRAAARR
jgi:hypothetical protein